MHKLLPSH